MEIVTLFILIAFNFFILAVLFDILRRFIDSKFINLSHNICFIITSGSLLISFMFVPGYLLFIFILSAALLNYYVA